MTTEAEDWEGLVVEVAGRDGVSTDVGRRGVVGEGGLG